MMKTKFETPTSLEASLTYRNDGVIGRISLEIKVSSDQEEMLFVDARRFLFPETQQAIVQRSSRLIGEARNAVVLHTHDDADFCRNHSAKSIHRQPDLPNVTAQDKGASIGRTVNLAVAVFGQGLSKYSLGRAVDCSKDCIRVALALANGGLAEALALGSVLVLTRVIGSDVAGALIRVGVVAALRWAGM